MKNKRLKLYTKYWVWMQFGGNKKKWKTFEHNGVLFPPEYVKHNIPITYNGEKIILNKLAEEYGTLFAKFIDTEYMNNKIFKKNFWKDWKKIVNNEKIVSLDDCDFTEIYKYILKTKEVKKNESKEEKQKLKKQRDEEEAKYKTAKVDGKEQPVGNYRIEPPGIFIGRGCHPKLGCIKKRIYPEDITINIGIEAKIPDPLEGHKWGNIIHDRSVEWLASWKDTITNKTKYVWLASHSDQKTKNDILKYDLARKLKKKIMMIRETNTENL